MYKLSEPTRNIVPGVDWFRMPSSPNNRDNGNSRHSAVALLNVSRRRLSCVTTLCATNVLGAVVIAHTTGGTTACPLTTEGARRLRRVEGSTVRGPSTQSIANTHAPADGLAGSYVPNHVAFWSCSDGAHNITTRPPLGSGSLLPDRLRKWASPGPKEGDVGQWRNSALVPVIPFVSGCGAQNSVAPKGPEGPAESTRTRLRLANWRKYVYQKHQRQHVAGMASPTGKGDMRLH